MKISRAFPRTAVLALAALALATGWLAWGVSAEDEETTYGNTARIPFYDLISRYSDGWKFSVMLGGVFADEEGIRGVGGLSAGQAAEFRSAENYVVLGVRMMFDRGSSYSATKFILFGEDEYLTESNSSQFGRILTAKSRLDKYPRRLTNDQALDWSNRRFSFDSNSAGAETGFDVTHAYRANRVKLPWLKGSTIIAVLDLLDRSGSRQARTLNHCSGCHVATAEQLLKQRTWDLRLGGEYKASNWAARYVHRYRYLDDNSQGLTHEYVNRFGNFDLEGNQPYSVPYNNSRVTDSGAARVDVGAGTTAIVKGSIGRTTNKSTGYQIDQNRFSGILTLNAARWLRLRGRYDRFEWENEVPASASRDRDSFSFAATLRAARDLRFDGSYKWERVSRSGGTEVEETTTKAFRLKGTYRPDRTLRLSASWRHAEVDDPFGRVLQNSFSRVEGILLSPYGTDEDEFEVALVHTPTPGSSVTLSYRHNSADSDFLSLESTTQQFTAAGHYRVAPGVVVHGRAFFYDNDYDRDVYLGVLAPLLEIVNVPYSGKGTSLLAGISLRPMPSLLLRPSYGYVKAESSFDDGSLGSGVATASEVDATINRFFLEADLELSERIGLMAVYNYDDYSDEAQPLADGTVHWLYAGVIFKF